MNVCTMQAKCGVANRKCNLTFNVQEKKKVKYRSSSSDCQGHYSPEMENFSSRGSFNIMLRYFSNRRMKKVQKLFTFPRQRD